VKRENEDVALFRRRRDLNRNQRQDLLDHSRGERGRDIEHVAVVSVDCSRVRKRKGCEWSKLAGKGV